MNFSRLCDMLECAPVIAAVQDSKWDAAVESPVNIIFYLQANILSLKEKVDEAHKNGKLLFVHIDLAEGIGRDRSGVEYLAKLGIDGIMTTRSQLVRFAKENGLIAVQRFFLLDSKGYENIDDIITNITPDMIEIMPGVIPKAVERFASGRVPVIAGGLVETKQEVTQALNAGATAISTGKPELWYI